MPFEVVHWDGPSKPEVVTANPVSPQMLDYIERLRDKCAAETGVSIQATSGMRPAGLNSAPAQREWIDLITARLTPQQQRWEEFWRDSAQAVIALCDATSAKPTTWRKLAKDNVLEDLRWAKIKLKPEQYRVRYMLSSALSLTTSGRMEQLADLKANGAIDQGEYNRMLGLPDIEQASDRANAPRDLVEKQIDMALNEGVIETPSPMQGQGLNDLIRLGALAYQQAVLKGTYPPENLEALRRLIKAAEARLQPPPAPEAPPAALPAQPDAAQPMPPVTNA
jgi:hypothetical protein